MIEDLDSWLEYLAKELQVLEQRYPSNPKQERSLQAQRKQLESRTRAYLNTALERFRPELQARLLRRLPLWFVANLICIRWEVVPPLWLQEINYFYIIWTVTDQFMGANQSPRARAATAAYVKLLAGDKKAKGRHSKAGTAAQELWQDFETMLTYEYGKVVSDSSKPALLRNELSIVISSHLHISEDTLKKRRKRVGTFFKTPAGTADAVAFQIDFKGITEAVNKARGRY